MSSPWNPYKEQMEQMEVTAASSIITIIITINIINTAHYQWAFGPSSSRTEETGVSQSTASRQGGICWQQWTH